MWHPALYDARTQCFNLLYRIGTGTDPDNFKRTDLTYYIGYGFLNKKSIFTHMTYRI
jgi:hypothetical protein